MNMKDHILAAMREQFERWEELLGSMDEARLTTPLSPSEWSIKDNLAHLMAWQQRSTARMEAAHAEQEPQFPRWLPGHDPDSESSTGAVNDWIYSSYRAKPWSEVYPAWRAGFLRFLEWSEKIPERDLLDAERYPWLEGRPLAFILLASYDHHQEHYEKLREWLEQRQ